MTHRILLTATIVALALFPAALAFDATAAQPAEDIAHARISVPPPPAPPTLVMADGFNGLANPEPGVYHVSLAGSLEFTATSALSCTGTQPGVTCAVEILEPPPGQPYTNLVVYRERWGQPANGDVWLWALL